MTKTGSTVALLAIGCHRRDGPSLDHAVQGADRRLRAMRKFLLAGAAVATLGFSTISEAHAFNVVKDWSKPGEPISVQQIVTNDGSQKCWLGIGGSDNVMFSLDFFQSGSIVFRIISSNRDAPWTGISQIQLKFDNGSPYKANASLDSSGHVLSAGVKDEGEGKNFLHDLWNGQSFHATAGSTEVDFPLTGSATALLHLHQCRYEIAPQIETAANDGSQPHFTPPAAHPVVPATTPEYVPPPAAPVSALAPPPVVGPRAVKLIVDDGSYYVEATIDNAVHYKFAVDTGASLVTIPQDFADYLMQHNALSPADYKGVDKFTIADGSTRQQNLYTLHTVSIDGVTAHNVLCSVGPAGSPFLLGKSFFDKFNGGFSINPSQGTMTLTP
jgi:hypothetical protein